MGVMTAVRRHFAAVRPLPLPTLAPEDSLSARYTLVEFWSFYFISLLWDSQIYAHLGVLANEVDGFKV